MSLRDVEIAHPPPHPVVRAPEHLLSITFNEGLAFVEVPVAMLHLLPLKHEFRMRSDRLIAIERSIRRRGYGGSAPVVCKIGTKDRWLVQDGGHRLTALKLVAKNIWVSLFRRDLGHVTFILFKTPRSELKATMEHAIGRRLGRRA